MRLGSRFPLDIHVWGGFASQLNGLATALEVSRVFPRRPARLVFHTSGITRRNLEIFHLIPDHIPFIEIDDYRKVQNKKDTRVNNITLRGFVSYLLKTIGIISEPKTYYELCHIRAWTLQLRGHYSYINFPTTTLKQMMPEVFSMEKKRDTFSASLHYRLGDLLSSNKGWVDPKILKDILCRHDKIPWNVFSDSVDVAKQMLSSRLELDEIRYFGREISSYETLINLVHSDIFVGTYSKISIWASVLRIRLSLGSKTYMPYELRQTLKYHLSEDEIARLLFFRGSQKNED